MYLVPRTVLTTGPRKRRPRTSVQQLAILNEAYTLEPMPCAAYREMLSSLVGLSSRSIQIWFQNRRQKLKQQENKETAIQLAKKKKMALEILEESFRKNREPSNEDLDDLSGLVDISAQSIRVWFQNKVAKVRLEEQMAGKYKSSSPAGFTHTQPFQALVDPVALNNQAGSLYPAIPPQQIANHVNAMYAQQNPDFSAWINDGVASNYSEDQSIDTRCSWTSSPANPRESGMNSVDIAESEFYPKMNMDPNVFNTYSPLRCDNEVIKEVGCNAYNQWSLFAQVFRSQHPQPVPLKRNLSQQDLEELLENPLTSVFEQDPMVNPDDMLADFKF